LRHTLFILCLLATMASAQDIALVSNDGATTTLTLQWAAADLSVEPPSIVGLSQPSAGRQLGLILPVDTLTYGMSSTDMLDAAAVGMKLMARSAGLPDPSFQDGLRQKLASLLMSEFSRAKDLAGNAIKAGLTPAQVAAQITAVLPPPAPPPEE
jgi:hypothetical protein